MRLNDYKRKIDLWAEEIPENVERALKKGAQIARAEAIAKHLSGPKMPVGMGSKKHSTLARRSGDLAASIIAESKRTRSGKFSAFVASEGVIYARIHEYGGKIKKKDGTVIRMPKRSYLRSSVKARQDQIARVLLKEGVMEAYG